MDILLAAAFGVEAAPPEVPVPRHSTLPHCDILGEIGEQWRVPMMPNNPKVQAMYLIPHTLR